MRAFIRRYLDPADRLGEILFGLIMALGFTGAVRLGREEADNQRALHRHPRLQPRLGHRRRRDVRARPRCSSADARARLVRDVRAAPTRGCSPGRDRRRARRPARAAADARGARTDLPLGAHCRPPGPSPNRPASTATTCWAEWPSRWSSCSPRCPIVVPYLVVSNPNLAVRLSNLIALTLLFLLGAWWGRVVGVRSFRIATGLTLLGVVLVLITIALGG